MDRILGSKMSPRQQKTYRDSQGSHWLGRQFVLSRQAPAPKRDLSHDKVSKYMVLFRWKVFYE